MSEKKPSCQQKKVECEKISRCDWVVGKGCRVAKSASPDAKKAAPVKKSPTAKQRVLSKKLATKPAVVPVPPKKASPAKPAAISTIELAESPKKPRVRRAAKKV